eukprot:6400022-Alexandrium_andersonii.AAC.1
MSASLVGSEMCIRDRGEGKGKGGKPGSPAAPRGPASVGGAKGAGKGAFHCLLYTSDAADDM